MENPPNLHQGLSPPFPPPPHTLYIYIYHQPRTTPKPSSKSNAHPPKPQSLTYIAFQYHLTTRPLLQQRISLAPQWLIKSQKKSSLTNSLILTNVSVLPQVALFVKDHSIPTPILHPSNVPWILVGGDHVIVVIPYHPKCDAPKQMPYVMPHIHTPTKECMLCMEVAHPNTNKIPLI